MSEGILGKARNDYEADAGNELSVKKGDILQLINFSDDSDWWKAKLNGQEGYLPKDIIELEKCEVVGDYFDVEEGQLRLSVGDRIEILQKENNKWYGRNSNGEEGHFSPSFIIPIPLTAPPMPLVSDPYGTLNSIKPNEILHDVRKDRPKKASKQITQQFLPERKSILKEPEVKTTPFIKESAAEAILRPKPLTRQGQPFIAELNEKTKNFTPITSTRKIVKSGNFDDIKNMWKNGIVKEPTPKKTEIITTRHMSHRKSVSNVRDQFETNILPENKYESRMFEIKTSSVSNIPHHNTEFQMKMNPIIYKETTLTNLQRMPSLGSKPRTEFTQTKTIETNLTEHIDTDDGIKIMEIKDEPEIKLSEVKNYPRGILRNITREVTEPKIPRENNAANSNKSNAISIEAKKVTAPIDNMPYPSLDKYAKNIDNKPTEKSETNTYKSNAISEEPKKVASGIGTVVYPNSDRYFKNGGNKLAKKSVTNSDKSIELTKRVEFLEIKVQELERIIYEIRNQK